MKRRVFKLVLSLLLGCVATIGIAWSLAYFIDVEGWAMARNNITPDIFAPIEAEGDDYLGSDYRHLWRSLEDEGIDHAGMVELQEYRLPGVHLVILAAGNFRHGPEIEPALESPLASLPGWCDDYLMGKLRSVVDDEDWVSTQVQGVGWPWPALWCAPAIADPMGSDEIFHPAVGGITLGNRPPPYWHALRVRTLPLRPIWEGFAINTVFYASVLWMLMLCPHTLCRMIRRKRGRCIKCAYDLRGTSGGDFSTGCPECGWGRESEA